MDFLDDLFDLQTAVPKKTIYRFCSSCSRPLKLEVDLLDLTMNKAHYQSPLGECCR